MGKERKERAHRSVVARSGKRKGRRGEEEAGKKYGWVLLESKRRASRRRDIFPRAKNGERPKTRNSARANAEVDAPRGH